MLCRRNRHSLRCPFSLKRHSAKQNREFGDGQHRACGPQTALYRRAMTDAERIEALLDIVDDARPESRDQSEKLAVFGLVERRGKNKFWPTNAGWNLLGDRGRVYDNA